MVRVLQQIDRHPFRRPGWEGEERDLPFMCVRSRDAWSLGMGEELVESF